MYSPKSALKSPDRTQAPSSSKKVRIPKIPPIEILIPNHQRRDKLLDYLGLDSEEFNFDAFVKNARESFSDGGFKLEDRKEILEILNEQFESKLQSFTNLGWELILNVVPLDLDPHLIEKAELMLSILSDENKHQHTDWEDAMFVVSVLRDKVLLTQKDQDQKIISPIFSTLLNQSLTLSGVIKEAEKQLETITPRSVTTPRVSLIPPPLVRRNSGNVTNER
jgi:hypothetical protein